MDAAHDGKKNLFKLSVKEKQALTPLKIKAAVPEGYDYKGATVTITGTVSKEGEEYSFKARGSGQIFTLKPNEAVKNGAGKVWTITGKWSQAQEKKPAVIEVTSAKEPK